MRDRMDGKKGCITRREALKALGLTAAAVGMGCTGRPGRPGKKLLILGFDGMDFNIVSGMLDKGELPNFRKVADKGSFLPLVSSTPPQSPVAWSNFITGKNPGGHGIFDFIVRDPKTYLPGFSLSKVTGSDKTVKIAGKKIPLTKGKVELLRKGEAWWSILERNGIPSTVLNVPSNFPPVETKQKSISGMGTPDILGTYGTFSFYTTEYVDTDTVQGGKIFQVEATDGRIDAELVGPKDTLVEEAPDIKLPFTMYVDPDAPQARVKMQDADFILREGEWSDWVRVSFPIMPMVDVKGILRVYLKSVRPEFKLYISPVQIDPENPSVPISTPPDYSRDVSDAIGPFYTQGIPEDTWALNEGRLDEDEFLAQAAVVRNERTAVYRLELEKFRRATQGAYFCYFGTTDTGSHMFWCHRDPKHPMHDPVLSPKYAGAIEEFYREMDKIVGTALNDLNGSEIIIMSDHGFSPFYRAFHVNRWLYDNGYLVFLDDMKGESEEAFENVDWSKTRAYAIGLNGLYINLAGREGEGIVSKEEKAALVAEIAAKLRETKDPQNGERMVAEAYDTSKIYTGPYKDEAPDIIVGFAGGYRSSWETALGKVPPELVRDNNKKWSGDHCMDPAFVPGIFFSSMKLAGRGSVNIEDIAPSILAYFGVKGAEEMDGKSFF